jgi:serine protease Do
MVFWAKTFLISLVSVSFLVSAFADQQPTPATPITPPVVTAKSVYDSVSELVFPVITAVAASAPKASYGSGFVVTRSGILITNYHVVAEVVNRPKTYHLFVMLKNKPTEARILAIDVIHDLAAIKVEETFPSAVQISQSPLSTGQKLFSIGQPEDLNMSVIEGNFNGLQQLGPYETIVLSSPINHGMSGGPTLNESGQVAGVNVAVLNGAQNVSFAVPSHFIIDMCKNAASSRKPASAQNWDKEISANLTSAETVLTESWLKNNVGKSEFPGWKTLAPPPGIKCWRESENKGKMLPPQSVVEYQICRSNFEAHPSHDLKTSTYELNYLSVSKLDPSSTNFYGILNSLYPLASPLILADFAKRGPAGSRTESDCSERVVVNSKNTSLKVNYCTSAYVKYTGLVDTVVKFATLNSGPDALIVTLRLNGFTPEHIQAIVDAFLESVEKS